MLQYDPPQLRETDSEVHLAIGEYIGLRVPTTSKLSKEAWPIHPWSPKLHLLRVGNSVPKPELHCEPLNFPMHSWISTYRHGFAP